MIQIQLQRTRRKGKAIVGKMTIPFSHIPLKEDEHDATVDTLENADYLIPAGTYHLARTWSPKFKKLLPLVEDVPDYSDTGVTGAPGANQQSVCDGESRGRSCPVDLAERYQQSQPPCRMRQGIRIHRGSIPEHSTGCILTDMTGQAMLDVLFNRIENYFSNEETFIQIEDRY